ncbi:MAG: Rap1a/Tai family immunity protein [Alphaproteobacteria bacterium]|nr:Rap1a/Tai family immunity protein [Alphaproteobacteria bacterium]
MRPFSILTLFFCLLCALPIRSTLAAVNSDGMTGHELLVMCNSRYDTDYGFCAGYVSGIANAMLAGPVSGERACSHGPVRSQQLIDLYRSYAEIFPENLRGAAAKNVAVAIARGFPCPE